MPTSTTINLMKKGFTLTELLVVVAIVALLGIVLLTSVAKQRTKGDDVKIKADLERLRIAFEDYYNDNNCYPPLTWFDGSEDCRSESLKPYLNIMPCNPKTALPYVLDYPVNQCSSFKLYSTLANTGDPSITKLCVVSDGSTLGNYGVSSTNTTIEIDCSAFLPYIPDPGAYGCQQTICSHYTDPANAALNCDFTFTTDTCQNLCSDSAYWCHDQH